MSPASLPSRAKKRRSRLEQQDVSADQEQKSQEQGPADATTLNTTASTERGSGRPDVQYVVQHHTPPSDSARSRESRPPGNDDEIGLNSSPSTSAFLNLSDELILLILEHLEGPWEISVPIDKRAYLSVESFGPPLERPENAVEALGRFRLICRRLAVIGASRQFSRVTTRFSQHGFERLERIAKCKDIAQAVKKFTYMVPYFWTQGKIIQSLSLRATKLNEVPETVDRNQILGQINSVVLERRIHEQTRLISSREDVRVLKLALTAFTSLQHIQILPVQDDFQASILNQLRRYPDLDPSIAPQWAAACSHSTRTLAEALIISKSSCSHFSSPFISPQSAQSLTENPPSIGRPFDGLQALASGLTCLELHFDWEIDLDAKLTRLSPFFLGLFTTAKNLQAVHIGFPAHRPVNISLETIFHSIYWEKLVAFGIQAWKVDAEEILAIALRHRARLRGLRLRNVLLKGDALWKDVLTVLRSELRRLDWISLRRVGYAKTFDEQTPLGHEIFDDPPGGSSSSDSEDDNNDDDEYEDSESEQTTDSASPRYRPDATTYGSGDSDTDESQEESDSEDTESDGENDTDDGRDTGRQEMSFPDFSSSPHSPRLSRRPLGEQSLTSSGSIEDDGREIPTALRRRLEQWVIRRSHSRS